MIKFKRKNYTIQEGHYTGPKDLENIPGYLDTLSKGTAIGAVTGGVVGHFKKDSTIIDGAITGGRFGALGGLLFKFLLNYLHKPMSSIKYQEVDRGIRRQFGVFQISGVTVGDTLNKRANIEDKFSFNDRDVSNYKLNFAIHNNQVTMYTFGMTKEELDNTSKVLDYYCKKYFSMEYSASIINQKVNSYAVNITFTNYPTICQFIMELSNKLNTKINLLDNNAIVLSRLSVVENEDEKTFSLSQYDLMKMIVSGLRISLASLFIGLPKGQCIAHAVQSVAADIVNKSLTDKAQRDGYLMNKGSYNNSYLEDTLKKLHYVEGYHYTKGDETSEINLSLLSGVLLITTTKDFSKKFDDNVWKNLKTKIQRKELPDKKVVVYLYTLDKLSEFDMILKKILSFCVPNVFDKELKFKRKR